MENREHTYAWICRILFVLSILFAIVMGIYNFFCSTPYYVMLSVCLIPMICIPTIFYRVFHLTPVPSTTLFAYLFLLLAYGVGMIFNAYSIVPYYDKVMHTVSGVLFGLIGIFFFYLLKREKQIEKQDCVQAMYFCVSLAALSAVLWEIIEYVLNLLLHNDAQKVLLTGVNDTMQDMMVCLLGAGLLCISLALYYRKGKKSFCMGLMESFYHYNIAKKE